MMEQLNLNFTLSSCHLPLWRNVNDKWATIVLEEVREKCSQYTETNL